MINLRQMRWAWHVACMGEMRNAFRILVGKLEEKKPLRRLGIDGDNISMDLRVTGSCKHDNEPLSPIKGGEFVD
jgi:hypothetical protein